jgi:hypothetical protein
MQHSRHLTKLSDVLHCDCLQLADLEAGFLTTLADFQTKADHMRAVMQHLEEAADKNPSGIAAFNGIADATQQLRDQVVQLKLEQKQQKQVGTW